MMVFGVCVHVCILSPLLFFFTLLSISTVFLMSLHLVLFFTSTVKLFIFIFLKILFHVGGWWVVMVVMGGGGDGC